MLIVVSYDVVDDTRRAKVARVLEDHGERVQKSVFECLLEEPTLLRLRGKLGELIDRETDSVRYYRLCRRCRSTIEVQGTGIISDDQDLILV